MKIQRAVYEIKALPLSGDWAHQVACEKFGAELVDSFPKVARGRHAGKPGGYLCYIKATVGGWANNLPSGRGVVFPGASDWSWQWSRKTTIQGATPSSHAGPGPRTAPSWKYFKRRKMH